MFLMYSDVALIQAVLSRAALHPGLKGIIFIGIFAIGYFVYTQIPEDSGPQETSLRQQAPSANKKWNDGSLPTKNF